jgi:tol-pal system protein YbgF
MKKIITTAAAALMTTLWVTAPAAAQNREHQQMAAELRILQEQTQQLAVVLTQLTEAIRTVNARLDASDKAMVKSLADHKLVIDGLARDLDVVRQGTQDTNSSVRRIAEELDALRTSLPSLLTQAAPPAPVGPIDPNAPPGSTPQTAPVAVAPPLPSTLGTSPSRLYDTAWADYTAGQFSLAISGFEGYLKAFPQLDKSDDAQFLIGESYFQQNRFADAIPAYNLVIQNYPKGDQVAAAYYKRGLAQRRLGDVDAARASWETVVKNYPNEPAAILAKQGLDSLGRAQPAAQRSPG